MVPKVDRVVSLHSLAPILAGLAVVVSPTVAFAASFTSLGDLPGGAAESFAFALSDDGSTVVGGSATDAGNEAFVWRRETGLVGLSAADDPRDAAPRRWRRPR